MGDLGSVPPPIATSNKGITAVSAGLMSKIDNFFMTKFYGSFTLSVIASVLTCLSFFHLKNANRSKRESELRELKDKLQQILDNQATFCSPQTVSSEVLSTANRDSAHQNTSTSAVTSSADVRELGQSDPSLVAPNLSHVELPPSSSKKISGAYLRPKALGCINTDGTRSRSLELCASSSSHGSSPSQGVKEDPVIDVAALLALPSMAEYRAVGNKLIKDVEREHGVSFEHDVSSSRILQAKLKLTVDSLRALRNIAVKFMKVDKGSTLQFGGCYLYYCDGNPEEPVMLNLREVEVPTVLQADYLAGVLTIRGAYLQGAEFRATTSDGYMILKSITQDESNNNTTWGEAIEVWKCTDPLPPYKLDEVKIFASRRVTIQGHDVTVRSEVTPIVSIFWKTVFRNWLPTATLIVFLISQAWRVAVILCNVVENPLHRSWLFQILPACAIFIIQLVPARFEDNIKDFMERVKLGISSFHVLPNLLGSPAFFMRNGYCYQRGAEHLVHSKYAVEGSDPQAGKNPGDLIYRKKEPATFVGKPAFSGDTSKISGGASRTPPTVENRPDITSPDWKWSCWRYVGRNMEKFDPHSDSVAQPTSSDPSDPSDPSEPFSVIYSSDDANDFNFSRGKRSSLFEKELYCIKDREAIVRLNSKYLQRVIKELLRTTLQPGTRYGEISARHLLAKFIFNRDLHQSHLDFAETDESERLHMRHLIRFLQTEYEDTITEYERMEKAGVISFKMLWALMVADVDVVYYCGLTKEEQCGKVISADYQTAIKSSSSSRETEMEFKVVVEVYTYDCVNFRATTSRRSIIDFRGEAKITDMKIFPLRHKEKPLEAAEFFLNRGMKFCELVIKHERRFMHYQGLLYVSYPSGMGSKISYKESVDGRVMIDQGGFAIMKPNREMGTAKPLRLSRGPWSRMDQDEIDKIKPLLKYAPPKVFGFSFSSRRWGCFAVEGFSEIEFVSTAFDMPLIMKEETKKTLLTLSEHHIKGTENVAYGNPDPLPHKGKGCIILLYGPSGTGKTLTAETLAEKFECPLWQMSVSKLSTSTKSLETKLLRKFEIAASWGAILLLDEADVYLSSRKYSPLSSDLTPTNATTGVFLRVLEYYTGLLFLTTNMVDNFEEAIFSRMSLFVEFREFDDEERKQLWTGSLNRVGFQEKLSPEFWKEILSVKFNGHVVRNVIQNGQILAQGESKPLSEAYLLEAFEVMATPSARKHLMRCIEEDDQKQTPRADFFN